ncbi:MAG: nuclear transport factor 2 family protein [Pseudomonadota bacterium]
MRPIPSIAKACWLLALTHIGLSATATPAYAPLPRALDHEQRLQDTLDVARSAFEADPSELNTIWLGRRLAYLKRYADAIEIFTGGLARYPESYRLLRHRGHRYISTRQFSLALADFQAAYALMPKGVTEIEPDGIPNRLDTPLSNTQFNILYHWGLVHYLLGDFASAAERYRECLDYSANDDLQVATRDWLWMSLRRLGSEGAREAAAAVLVPVNAEMKVVENDAYLKRLLLYKDELTVDALLRLDAEDASLALATQGYGVANWYYLNGRWAQARSMLERVLDSGNWPAFGYMAAEADRARGVPDLAAAGAVLDTLHTAAANADWVRYFDLYHPTARFLGTDATEDWDIPTFQAYASATDGWTYTLRDRVLYRPAEDVVMFHELLDNAKYGTSRGSGALVWEGGRLLVAQYHLTFPIPNDLAEAFTQRIQAHEAAPPSQP